MISACMAISVRELRTAVREWACWYILFLKSLSKFSYLFLIVDDRKFVVMFVWEVILVVDFCGVSGGQICREGRGSYRAVQLQGI